MQNNCTRSPLDDAFGLGLEAGLGLGNFKINVLGMHLPCLKSLVTFVTKPMCYVAALHFELKYIQYLGQDLSVAINRQ